MQSGLAIRKTNEICQKTDEIVKSRRWVLAWNMKVTNKLFRWTTVENTQGGKSYNIDVTIVSRNFQNIVQHWEVVKGR